MNIITRKGAIEKGLTRYYTGKPCKHGHVCERTTVNRSCISCHRKSAKNNAKEYYKQKKNKAKKREYYQSKKADQYFEAMESITDNETKTLPTSGT